MNRSFPVMLYHPLSICFPLGRTHLFDRLNNMLFYEVFKNWLQAVPEGPAVSQTCIPLRLTGLVGD